MSRYTWKLHITNHRKSSVKNKDESLPADIVDAMRMKHTKCNHKNETNQHHRSTVHEARCQQKAQWIDDEWQNNQDIPVTMDTSQPLSNTATCRVVHIIRQHWHYVSIPAVCTQNSKSAVRTEHSALSIRTVMDCITHNWSIPEILTLRQDHKSKVKPVWTNLIRTLVFYIKCCHHTFILPQFCQLKRTKLTKKNKNAHTHPHCYDCL